MSEPKLSEDLQGELGQRLAAGQHAAWREAIQRSEALEARLSKMDGLEIRISDGDVWLHFPNAAISIEGICRFGAPGPIVKKNLRAWRDEALAGEDK
ncbi:hypothetical protein LCGC14_2941650 [marine sediment metagenome]|uniref:Uncharacterized protein n=1 Tax=marine sediment metagenome TaxID=412755 RepID=A0A0F8XHR9_9ZZZZ